ncbi:MAG: hypothetical protein BalsKO_25480 [Balneolaceae bacterium]
MSKKDEFFFKLRLNKKIQFFLLSMSLLVNIYVYVYIFDVWDNSDFSRIGLIIAYALPSSLFLFYSIMYFSYHRIIIKPDYVEYVSFISSKIYFKDITKISIGSNFITLIKSKRKKITVSWIYPRFDEVKEIILKKIKEVDDVEYLYPKNYRASKKEFRKW